MTSRPFAPWGLRIAVVVGAVAMSAFMVARSQIWGDQWKMLTHGWELASHGHLVPYGNPFSRLGGFEPGPATSVLTGLPLIVWHDYRAPAAFVLLTHLLAWWLVDRTLRNVLGPRERLFLFVLYGVGPWRIFFSGFLWNPNFLFLVGATHLATCWASRERASFWASAIQVAAIGIGFQLHISASMLALATLILALRGVIKLHVAGVVCGAALVAASFVPWAIAAHADPSILPRHGDGHFGIVRAVYNAWRWLYYTTAFGSFCCPEKMTIFDLAPTVGPAVARWAQPVAMTIIEVLGNLSVIVPLVLVARFWKRPSRWWGLAPRPLTPRRWVEEYSRWTLVAAVATCALNPQPVMMWCVLVVFHAALYPIVHGLGARSRLPQGRWIVKAVPATVVLFLAVDLVFALGSVPYQFGWHYQVGKDDHANLPIAKALHMEPILVTPPDGDDSGAAVSSQSSAAGSRRLYLDAIECP